VFGTYVLVFLLLIAFAIVLSSVLIVLPLWLRGFVYNFAAGTLIAPFLALVSTLIYYRLTAAHSGQPYTPTGQPYSPTGPAGTPGWGQPPTTPPDQGPTAPPPNYP
jgi:hypothetical protein